MTCAPAAQASIAAQAPVAPKPMIATSVSKSHRGTSVTDRARYGEYPVILATFSQASRAVRFVGDCPVRPPGRAKEIARFAALHS
jgi:hypothetical protein